MSAMDAGEAPGANSLSCSRGFVQWSDVEKVSREDYGDDVLPHCYP